jgi:hypothetical protein
MLQTPSVQQLPRQNEEEKLMFSFEQKPFENRNCYSGFVFSSSRLFEDKHLGPCSHRLNNQQQKNKAKSQEISRVSFRKTSLNPPLGILVSN